MEMYKDGDRGNSVSEYLCYRSATQFSIDGDLTKSAWKDVPFSPRFKDMLSGSPGLFDTRVAALWDDRAFYVAFRVEEPFVNAQLVTRDETVFRENDVEIFIDGGTCYYEFEVNALNTVYEVFFIWKDAYSGFDPEEFNVHSEKAYTFGGNHDRDVLSFWKGTHPRGLRWAFTGWDFPGLQSAVRVQGTLNDNSDVDSGWTVEIMFPWEGMSKLAGGRQIPPADGDVWRMFFGRFGKLPVGNELVSSAMSLDPVWDNDNHIPELFSKLRFINSPVPSGINNTTSF